MSAPEAAAQPRATWDESQCITALAQMERLQAQIDGLRLAIPRIIEPFHRASNPATFKSYAQGVLTSQNDIKQLHELWRTPEIQSTFKHVEESLTADSDLSASASVPPFGWVERERKGQGNKKQGPGDDVEHAWISPSEEEVSNLVAEFHKSYPNIKVDMEDNSNIHIQLVSGTAKLKFHINIDRDTNGRHNLVAECLGSTEPSLTISKCLATRARPNDLKYLLDMLAAYKTVKGLSCATCGQLLDEYMLTPLARRNKVANGTNDTSETTWEAFHEGCL